MSVERASRTYPTRPFAGVGAVVWNGKQVLIERRGQPPRQGAWALPGGLIELGEVTEDAVRREVREECGIEVRVGPLLGVFQPIELDAAGRVRYHFVVLDYLAYYVSGDLQSGDDAAEVRWVRPLELGQYALAPEGRNMIERALALLAAETGSE